MRGTGARGVFCLVVIALLNEGCDVVHAGACTAEAAPAIVVEVVDATTGAPAAEGVAGILTDGSYADARVAIGVDADDEVFLLGGAFERPGTYDVKVEKEGYRTWTRTGVRVREGDCGPRTVRLTARLERL